MLMTRVINIVINIYIYINLLSKHCTNAIILKHTIIKNYFK